jgi:hypothetical protein
MLDLKSVDLICVDCVSLPRAERAIRRCLDVAEFHYAQLLSSLWPDGHKEKIGHIGSLVEYSKFMIRELGKYVKAGHCLVIQHDGFIINTSAWNPAFLEYDYIGAPWWMTERDGFGNVGNGGFSLRSRKLLDWCATYDFGDKYHPEDNAIGLWHTETLRKTGLKIATEAVAAKFSWEGNGKYPKYNNQFGYHGGRPPR